MNCNNFLITLHKTNKNLFNVFKMLLIVHYALLKTESKSGDRGVNFTKQRLSIQFGKCKSNQSFTGIHNRLVHKHNFCVQTL